MKNKKMVSAGLTLAFGVVALAGCATTAKVSAPRKAAETAPAAAHAQAPAIANPDPVLSGKVIETMNAGGYTYLSIEKDGKQGWAAVPETKAAVGDEIALIPGIDMINFNSTTLHRTFPSIHFSAGIKGAEAAAPKKEGQALPANHPALPKKEAAKTPAGKEAAAAVISGKVVEAMNAGGYTYLSLEKDGKTTWAAIPSTDVKVGSELAIQAGSVMPSFTSKSLNRTFQNIIFSPGVAAK